MSENHSFLHLEDVYVRYTDGSGNPFTVLNDIDLKVSRGEFVTVVGPSGCGKSTMLRLILGAEKPSEGKVVLEGNPIGAPNRDRGIVFQKYSLFPHLTVLQNIVFGLRAEQLRFLHRWMHPGDYRKKNREFSQEAGEYLARVGLADHGEKYPHQLSGGMRQRVAIAQSLIMKPKILLMDEPFGALDDSTRQEMQIFMLEQWERYGMTVFFVTHDLDEACFLGSRVLVLSQYYQTDAPKNEGAKLVTDVHTPGKHPKPTSFKYSPEMAELVHKIRRDGLDPKNRQHIKDFDLSHKDSFRTVMDHEWRNP